MFSANCSFSFGRTTSAAELAFSSESQSTKMPYSPSVSSPNTVTLLAPRVGCDQGCYVVRIDWA